MATACTSPQEAIELVVATLHDEYGARPDPAPDDHLHSPIVRPNIDRLRKVIGFLRTLPAGTA
jgi:hypothetical protein